MIEKEVTTKNVNKPDWTRVTLRTTPNPIQVLAVKDEHTDVRERQGKASCTNLIDVRFS